MIAALWAACSEPSGTPELSVAASASDSGVSTSASKELTEPVARAPLQLSLPVAEPDALFSVFVVGVDHDPEVVEPPATRCLAYDGLGFPFCYDEHDGSDFLLSGGFEAMDAGSATVVAAADGTVIDWEDGNYDRCHADVVTGEIDCDGYPMQANYVKLAHPGGEETWYWHLLQGSVAVELGQVVRAGESLGRIGSSGNSSAPHLHLEVRAADGAVVDPFGGDYSQPETWWCVQGERGSLPGACEAR